MKFDVSVDKFCEYLETIRGIKDGSMISILIEATPDGLMCGTLNEGKTRAVKAIMRKEAFVSYNANEGDYLTTNSVDKFLSVLKRFDKQITLSVENKRIFIKEGKREVSLVMPDKEYVSSTSFNKKIPYTHQFEVDSKVFESAIKNANAMDKDDGCYAVSVKGKELSISTGNTKMNYFTERSDLAHNDAGDIVNYFKSGFEACFTNAGDKLIVSTLANGPIQIEWTKDNMSFTNICSPFITEEVPK